MVKFFKQLLMGFKVEFVVHDHRFSHRHRQKKHGQNKTDDSGPSKRDKVGIFLIARCKSAAGMGEKVRMRLKKLPLLISEFQIPFCFLLVYPL